MIEAFASFGFCKAHAAAFALPTYQSAWLKAHWPAHFLAGVLTHDPGMYPKRLILEDARQCGIAILGLDVNASEKTYVVERMSSLDEPPPIVLGQTSRPDPTERGWPDGRAWGIRLALAEVKGINAGEIERIVSARPYHSLTDFWHRAQVSRPIAERLVLAGGFDSVYGLGSPLGGLAGVRRRTQVTRRDLLLQVAELDRHARAVQRAGRARGLAAGRGPRTPVGTAGRHPRRPGGRARQHRPVRPRRGGAGGAPRPGRAGCLGPGGRPVPGGGRPPPGDLGPAHPRPRRRAPGAGQWPPRDESRGADAGRAGDPRARREPPRRRHLRRLPRRPRRGPQPRPADRAQPGRDPGRGRQGRHPDPAGPVRAPRGVPDPRRRHRPGRRDLLRRRPGPLRRHRVRLVAAGGPRRGTPDRPPRRLPARHRRLVAARPPHALGQARSRRRDRGGPRPAGRGAGPRRPRTEEVTHRRVLVHSSGFQMSPYADVKPAGEAVKDVARKLWHRSPGSPG